MFRLTLLAAATLAAATPVNAQADAERLAQYVALYQANDCLIERATQADFFTAAGFADAAERQGLGFSLLLTGQVRIEENGMRLLGEECPIVGYSAPEDLARVEDYVALIERNGCELDAMETQTVLGQSAFQNLGEVAQIGAYLVAEGRLAYAGDPHRVVLISDACPAQ